MRCSTASVLYITKGTSTHEVPSLLGDFAVGRVGGIPYLAFVALVGDRPGRGRDPHRPNTAADLSRSAPTNRRPAPPACASCTYQIATYVFAGAIYAVAGVLLAGYLGIPSLLVGNTYLLPTITVVVLGGTSLLGGAGSVAATAVGAIFLTQLQQVTIGMGARTSAQFIIQAVIIALGMALRLVPWAIAPRRSAGVVTPHRSIRSGRRAANAADQASQRGAVATKFGTSFGPEAGITVGGRK